MKPDQGKPLAAMQPGGNWYQITNQVGQEVATATIYDEIGMYGITASDFIAELGAVNTSRIDLRISSPGGEIFDGIAIHNALRAHSAYVTTYVDSLAASIASVIALAGDRVVMLPHSQMMIHDASGLCLGNAADMQEMADLLDRQSNNIAAIYAEKAGGRVDGWRKRMKSETWYTAKEAVEAGLADEVAKQTRKTEAPAAQWDLSAFRYQNRDAAPAPDLATEPPTAEPEHAPEPGEDGPDDAAPAAETPVEPGPLAVVPDPAPETVAPVEATDEPEPSIDAQPEPDPWELAVAQLTTVPDPDAEFARLTEALQ